MKPLRILAALILSVGACLTGRALYMHAKAELAGILIRRAWNISLQSGKSHAPWPWADTHPIARLRIPRLGYDEIVLEGATGATLAFGPARLMSGAELGQPGNLVLAGHRTSWFRSLEGIAADDKIQVDWFDSRGGLHSRTYTVNMIRVVQPEDVSLLAPTSEDSLTLITCYPFGNGLRSPQRFVVRAAPVAVRRETCGRYGRADGQPRAAVPTCSYLDYGCPNICLAVPRQSYCTVTFTLAVVRPKALVPMSV